MAGESGPETVDGQLITRPTLMKALDNKPATVKREPKLLDAYGSPMLLGGKQHSDPEWNRLAAHPDRRGTTHTSRRDRSKFHSNLFADKKFYKRPPILKQMDQLEGLELMVFIEENFDQIEEAQAFYANINPRDPWGDVFAPSGVKHDAYMAAMKPNTGQYWKKAGVFDDQLPSGMTAQGLGTALGSWLNPDYVAPKIDPWTGQLLELVNDTQLQQAGQQGTVTVVNESTTVNSSTASSQSQQNNVGQTQQSIPITNIHGAAPSW